MTMTPEQLNNAHDIESALRAVGELLEASDQRVSIVVIGGAALNLLGIIERATLDVDVLAFTDAPGELASISRPPEPLPSTLASAIDQVARDYRLPANWMNAGPAKQWDIGLPPGFADRLHWRSYPGLDVGIADRRDLIFFKLEAAADQPDANNRHFRDLLALTPTDLELEAAADWAREKNVGARYHEILDHVIGHVRNRRSATDS